MRGTKRGGLGWVKSFLSCVDAGIAAICRMPEMYAAIHEQYRRRLVHRFPYAIFYENTAGVRSRSMACCTRPAIQTNGVSGSHESEGISIMATTTITIQVEAEAAKAFAAASPEEQRKMQLLLSLRLQDLTTPQGKPLQAVMDEIGARAAARGLTPEILESLLRDE